MIKNPNGILFTFIIKLLLIIFLLILLFLDIQEKINFNCTSNYQCLTTTDNIENPNNKNKIKILFSYSIFSEEEINKEIEYFIIPNFNYYKEYLIEEKNNIVMCKFLSKNENFQLILVEKNLKMETFCEK